MDRKKQVIIGTILGLIVLVLGSAAVANASKPGDALFNLDKVMERAQLGMTSSEESQLRLRTELAEERRAELRLINPEDRDAVNQALDELRQVLNELGEDINDVRIRVELKQDTEVTIEELRTIVGDFVASLQAARADLGRLEVEVEDDEVRAKVRQLEIEIEELELEDNEAQVRGVLQGNQITINGRAITIAGPIDLAPFAGRNIKVEGALVGNVLTARELKLGAIKIEVEDGVPEARFDAALVQRAGDAFNVTLEGITFTLTGALTPQLDQVLNRDAEIRGRIVGTVITLERLRVENGDRIELRIKDDGEIEIKREDRRDGEDGRNGDDNSGPGGGNGGEDNDDDNGGNRGPDGGGSNGGSGEDDRNGSGSGGSGGGSGGSDGSSGSRGGSGSGGGGSNDKNDD